MFVLIVEHLQEFKSNIPNGGGGGGTGISQTNIWNINVKKMHYHV